MGTMQNAVAYPVTEITLVSGHGEMCRENRRSMIALGESEGMNSGRCTMDLRAHIMTQQLDDVLVKAHLQIHALAQESPRGPIKMCAHISRMGPLVMKLPKQSHGPIILSKE